MILGLVAGSACAHKDTAPALATPRLSFAKAQVQVGSPVDVTYQFDVAPNATFDADYHVLVHVEDVDGTTLWIDDFDPPTPTSQWKPGEHVEFTRTRFIPTFLELGDVTVRLGLYRGDVRLPLAGTDVKQRTYKVATLRLLAAPEELALTYKSGWNNLEVDQRNPASEWRWSQQSGLVSLKNPHRDATLYVEYGSDPQAFDHPQQVTLWVGTQQIATFAADHADTQLMRFPVPAAAFGSSATSELHIDVDRTFVPARLPGSTSHDVRMLGLRVFHLYVEPK